MRILLLESQEHVDQYCLDQINIMFPHVGVSVFQAAEDAIAAAPRLESVLICACHEMLTEASTRILRLIHMRLPRATVVTIHGTADVLALVSLFANGATMSEAVAVVAMDAELTPSRSSLPELSERESSVMQLLSQGLQNKMIARLLGLAVPTVKTHVSNIFRKLGVSTRLDAVCKFAEHSPAGGGVAAQPRGPRDPAPTQHWPLKAA